MTITTHRQKGSALTWNELDTNFEELKAGQDQIGAAVVSTETNAATASTARDEAVAAAAIYDDMNAAFVAQAIALENVANSIISLAGPTGAASIGTPDGTVQESLDSKLTALELSDADGATKVGSAGGITVQAALDARPTTAALAAADGAGLVKGTWFGGAVAFLSDIGTSIGSSLVGFIQAGAGTVARSLQDKFRESVTVADFGASPSASATVNTAAIQAAADYCESSGAFLRGSPGVHSTNETIVLKCSGDLSEMTLSVDATAVATAIRVGPNVAGQYLFNADLKLPFVINSAKVGAGWAGFDTSVGVDIANVYQSRIGVPSIYNFGVGLQEGGYGVGCVYNTITIGVLFGNKINQRLKPGDAAGWVNQNTHIGGRLAYSATEGTNVAGVVQIQTRSFDTATGNFPDTNVWMNPSVEGNEPAFHLDIQGKFNTIVSPRLEAVAAKINWHADSAGQTNANEIIGGYVTTVTHSYSGAGTSQNNQWTGTRTGPVLDFSGGGYNVRNTFADNNTAPHFQGFPAAVNPMGKTNADTTWTYRLYSNGLSGKATGDAFARVEVSFVNGYVFFGTGAAAATAGLRYNSTPGVLSITSDKPFSPDSDNALTSGTLVRRWSNAYAVNFRPGAGTATWTSGTGTPEGAVTATVGSMFTRTDGSAATTLYVKESGAGNTGWIAK